MGILSRFFKIGENNKSLAKANMAAATVRNAQQQPPSIDLLLSEITDNDASIRQKAAWKLGGGGIVLERAAFKDPRIIDALLLALNDETTNVRERAAWSLKEHLQMFGHNPRIVEALSSLLSDKSNSDEIMKEALEGLKRHSNKEIVQSAISLLSSPNKAVQDAAASLLGESRDPSAVEPLIAALGTSKEPYYLIGALGDIGDKRAVDVLVDLLNGRFKESITNYSTPGRIADALGKIRDSRAIDPLMSALAGAKNAMIGRSHYASPRKNYIDALKGLNAAKAMKVIKGYLEDNNEEVSAAAVAAVKYLQTIQTGEETALAEHEEDEGVTTEQALDDVRSMSLDRLLEEWKHGDSVRAGSELAKRAENQGDAVIVAVLSASGDDRMLSKYRLLKSSGQWRSSDAGLLVMEMTRRVVEDRH